ncbi:MAG: ferrous iron transport protein A [Anaerolineae bacterium]|nr:ferrous iron transport protein A [Anaerolineae bacterium]
MMPLSMVASGETVRLIAVRGGRGICFRLAELGLVPGATFQVIQGSGQGPLILAFGETRLALGRGMAHKIYVESFMRGGQECQNN